MALEQVDWQAGAGNDLHLLPGQRSAQLDLLLDVTAGGVTDTANRPPGGVTVAWTQSFGPGSASSAGVAVNPATGQVTIAGGLPTPPSPRLLDFLVIATVTDPAGGAPPPTLQAYLHVYVHTALRRMWLTPSRLTVPQGARAVRFSVLAEFDDGSYGDITNWSPWTRDGAASTDVLEVRDATGQAVAGWSSNTPAAIGVDANTGLLAGSTPAPTPATITLRTTTPAAAATGTAVGAPGWFSGAVVEEVDGPGFAAMADVPNVLIIGDGFLAAERPVFDALANKLVAEIYANSRLAPFGLLKDRLNFFRTMVPSGEVSVGGVSDWNAVDRFPTGVGTRANAFHADVSAQPTDPPTIALPVPNTSRFLLNERDTAFGAVFGDRPRAQRFNAMHGVHLSDRRIGEEDLDDFFRTLVDPSGTQGVGVEWKRGGKDETLIVVLARTERYGGANNSRSDSGKVIGVSLGNNVFHTIQAAGASLGHDILADPIPAAPHLVAQLLIVHELAHSFHLGDEYGSPIAVPPAPIPIPLGSPRDEANSYANLQTSDTLVDLNGTYDPELTKWSLWPRIRKAGVLTGAPVPITGGFRLQLGSGHATPFGQGDVVRLRTRPLPSSTQSGQLEVMADPATPSELQVRPLAGFNPAPFGADSIVLAPVLSAQGEELMLVESSVIGHLVTTKKPLNALPNTPALRPCPDLNEPVYVPGSNPAYQNSTPAWSYGPGNAPTPPSESAWITGLWERGHGFDCDVYHPTGACLMNVFTYDVAANKSFQFCWVCRYTLVDTIDPTKHGAVDKALKYRYPT